jgi:hypothetical protein
MWGNGVQNNASGIALRQLPNPCVTLPAFQNDEGMNKPFPRPDDENDLESLAHDLLGVDLNASDDEDDPLEVEGLGLDDLGFGAPPAPTPEQQETADEPQAVEEPSAEAGAQQAPQEEDPLGWLVSASSKSASMSATVSFSQAGADEDDDFGAGLGDDEPAPATAPRGVRSELPLQRSDSSGAEAPNSPPAAEAQRHDSGQTPNQADSVIDDDLMEDETETEDDVTEPEPATAGSDSDDYWDALEDWSDLEGGADEVQPSSGGRRPDRSGRPPRRERGKSDSRSRSSRSDSPSRSSRSDSPSRRGRPASRDSGRQAEPAETSRPRRGTSAAARTEPQPVPEDVDDDFGAGIWGGDDASYDAPDEDWSEVEEEDTDELILEDSFDEDDVDDEDDDFDAEEEDYEEDDFVADIDDVDDLDDDFGAGLEVAPPKPKRRRPPSRQRAKEESPPDRGTSERKERPSRRRKTVDEKPSQPETSSDEKAAARKQKYENIPTWEEAIALLSLKQPRPSSSDRRPDEKKRGRGGRGGRGGRRK